MRQTSSLHEYVKNVFEFDDWKELKSASLYETLHFLVSVIPYSEFFYAREYNKRNTEEGQRKGFLEEKAGNKLYSISDETDVVHWIAFEKKWESLFALLRPFLDEFLELGPFSAIDLTWEGD
jgi:hypothetical protein